MPYLWIVMNIHFVVAAVFAVYNRRKHTSNRLILIQLKIIAILWN